MLDKIVAIVLFILAFAILICIHEAGHLSMAKLFKVYCKEYSIGFGPAIYSKKKEGHETKFSIRAVPLGGYVAMYGEEGVEDDPEFKDIPVERSLEGVKKWKKAIVVAAGVILNAILAFILIFISDFAFPTRYITCATQVAENSQVADLGIQTNDRVVYILPDDHKTDDGFMPFSYEYTDSKKIIHAGSFYIIDSSVEFENGYHYVLCYTPTGNKNNPVFTDGLFLCSALTKEELQEKSECKKLFDGWENDYYPNIEDSIYKLEKDTKFNANVTFQRGEETFSKTISFTTKSSKNSYVFENIGLSFQTKDEWAPAGERMRNTFADYGSASIAVFKGIKTLFSGGIRNMSGIVGILDTSASLYSNYTFATYLYFWGLISVNLAVFNLLPFPGLDGWQLLVTAIEGISRKKLPSKFKTIMSLVGLGLLFLLMIAIVVLDVLRIAGI